MRRSGLYFWIAVAASLLGLGVVRCAPLPLASLVCSRLGEWVNVFPSRVVFGFIEVAVTRLFGSGDITGPVRRFVLTAYGRVCLFRIPVEGVDYWSQLFAESGCLSSSCRRLSPRHRVSLPGFVPYKFQFRLHG